MIKKPKIETRSKNVDEIDQNMKVKHSNLNTDDIKSIIDVKVESKCTKKDNIIELNVCKDDNLCKLKCDRNDKVLSLVCDYSSSGESSE